jgi:hypothetical protein
MQKKLKQQHKRYREKDEQLNDQALHFEILIQKLRPDLLSKYLQPNQEAIRRPDVRTVD